MNLLRPSFMSGRVRTIPPLSADPIRYNYLNVENAEPNFGVPSAYTPWAYNTYILTTNLTGGRQIYKTTLWDDTYTVVYQNSAVWLTKPVADTLYLQLTGGQLTGDLYVYGGVFATGGLSAVSATYFRTVNLAVTSLSVQSFGYSPTLFVGGAGGAFDLAVFKDMDNNFEVMRIKDAYTGLGKVGINTPNPGSELTVIGSISASDAIIAAGYSSNQYTSTYITTKATSGNWTDVYTTVKNFSASWEDDPNILPTVTNYLSTSNVLIKTLTVNTGLSVKGGLSADRIFGVFQNNTIDTYIGNGVTTIFNLSQVVASVNNILVYVGGIYQDKATYTITEGPPSTITFSQAPPAPDVPGEPNVEVVYFQANPLQIGTVADASITTQKLADKAVTSNKLANNLTIFGNLSVVGTLSASNYILTNSFIPYQAFNATTGQTTFSLLCAAASINEISVYVSGVYQNKSTYSLSDQYTLVLSEAPPAGTNIVEVVYSRPFPGSQQYPFNNSVITSSLADNSVTNPKLASNAVSTAKLSANAVTSDKLANQLILSFVTISNGLTTLETSRFVNTSFTVTSALSVINTNTTQPALFIGTSTPTATTTRVGINTTQPLAELTVRGTISASGTITSPSLTESILTTTLIFS